MARTILTKYLQISFNFLSLKTTIAPVELRVCSHVHPVKPKTSQSKFSMRGKGGIAEENGHKNNHRCAA